MRIENRIFGAVLCAALFAGCTGYEGSTEQDGVSFHISGSGKKAFVSECAWDASGDETRIVIPEQIDRAAVTSLGGFFGTGVPAPFCVRGKEGTYEFADNPYRSEYGAPLVFEEVPVTVVIPDTVTEITSTAGSGYYGSRNENGEIVFRTPAVRFECGEGNPAFTAVNGRLMEKDSLQEAEAAENLFRDAEEHPMTLRDRLLTRCLNDRGEEKEVYDFFAEFGHVYVHINSYMEGSEYMFTALDLIPLEEGILARTDIDTFDAEVRQFSDFAMAGQYTQPESPYCRIIAGERTIQIILLDENRNPITDSGIELERDMRQPSQFAVSMEDLERVNDGSRLAYPFGYYWENAITHVLEGDGVRVRIYRDGTVTIEQDAENTTVVYRGLTMTGFGMDDNDLRYAVKKLGGTAEPHIGRVTMEVKEDTVTFTACDGYESGPLIPEGKKELVCRIS